MSTAEDTIKDLSWLGELIDRELPRIEAEAEAEAQLEAAAVAQRGGWPAYHTVTNLGTGFTCEGVPAYCNKDKKPGDKGYYYAPHHEEEWNFVSTDNPRYCACLGGEGGGKSVAGSIKDLERLRRGVSGLLLSPTFEHFKLSLWQEFRRWIPEEVVDKTDRHMLAPTWEPTRPFQLHIRAQDGTPVILYCGGAEDPKALEGPNVNFAHLDEARRKDKADALKVLDGRVRIPGSAQIQPQLWFTTTPPETEAHWLYIYFGPEQEQDDGSPDPFLDFKRDSLVLRLFTEDNEKAGNLNDGFTRQRGQSLTEEEKRILLLAEWGNVKGGARFLDSMIWWDDCEESLPALSPFEPLIAAADAAYAEGGDTFGFVAVGRHPFREDVLVPRLIRKWEPVNQALDFDEIQADIEALKREYNIKAIHYDPKELHQMMTGLRKRRVVHTVEFQQGAERAVADKGLRDLIQMRRLAWSPQTENVTALRQHIDNADRKLEAKSGIRIVKRTQAKKIDLCVALSMACHRGARLWKIERKYPRSSAHSDYR